MKEGGTMKGIPSIIALAMLLCLRSTTANELKDEGGKEGRERAYVALRA